MPDRTYTDEELDAAIAEITDPTRFREAQELVMRAAPQLQRVLAAAMAEGGWFDAAHEQAVREAVAEADPEARLRMLRTLLAEETRLGMMVGVAVGFESGDAPGPDALRAGALAGLLRPESGERASWSWRRARTPDVGRSRVRTDHALPAYALSAVAGLVLRRSR